MVLPRQDPIQQPWTESQQQLLHILQQPSSQKASIGEICREAGVPRKDWYRAIKDAQFVDALTELGVRSRRVRRNREAHINVSLSANPEEELEKEIWDIRRLRSDYPKHRPPSDFEVDFTWINNPMLRQQVKRFFRHHLTRWKPSTFRTELGHLRPFLILLPQEVDAGTLTREHVERILPKLSQLPLPRLNHCLRAMRAMLNYMAASPAWLGSRPSRSLIWSEDIPSRPQPLPRPIPPDVLDQLDPLLEKAMQAIKAGQDPSILTAVYWDMILILRHTGMRFEDLAHLKAPDVRDHKGCLDQDSDGYWWIRIDYKMTKMGRDHRIPTRMSDGVVDAIRRQRERVKDIADHFGEHYLFRLKEGVVTRERFCTALKKLSEHLTYENKPYVITPHQFRHTIATDMIEQGIDIYTVKEFLGHRSLVMTEQYVKVYLTSLKAKYDAYRLKKHQNSAAEMMIDQIQVTHSEGEADGGWIEGNVGKLYISPLPDGIGNCAHLAMLDPCPTPPHCPTCPKLRANNRHLPVWENKANNLLITVEALRANPAYARARQKHEQELRQAEKVIETIKQEGFWDGRIHNS
jgi:site-specific recombinase XerD